MKKNIHLIYLFLFFTTLLNTSCTKLDLSLGGFRVYKILKGEHYSNSFYKVFQKNELHFAAIFDSSAIYTCENRDNQFATNKLYGFSDCFSQHHENSARFSWKWNENRLQINMYCYADTKVTSKYLTDIQLNKAYTYNIRVKRNYYIFTLNGVTDSLKRGCECDCVGYQLYPYFGGKETASHLITIKIKDLN